MKTKLSLALVAILTGTAFGSMPAVLPEFKNAKQLAEWRAEMAENASPQTTASEDHAFYTGKPYVESSGGYAFKYRSYNPDLARWTSEDPSGFPDGANNSLYACNTPANGLDPNGLTFLCLKGETMTVYSGVGKQGNTIDWGEVGVSWSAVSGGTDGANRIPNGWYSVGEKKAPAGFADSLAIGNRSEADFTSNGVTFQGTMAAWDKTGYNYHQGPSEYGNDSFYGYNPNDPHDAAIGAPLSVAYKFLLSGAYGNPVTVSDGYRIHPKDITTTHGCIGMQGYTGAAAFETWMAGNTGVKLLVE